MTSFNDVVKWRRMFHQYPELSKYEYKTTQRIKDILTSYNIKMIDIPMETGLVAEIGQGENVLLFVLILMRYLFRSKLVKILLLLMME